MGVWGGYATINYWNDSTASRIALSRDLNFCSFDKPIGASPGCDYEDGISTKNLVLNIILWCRAGNY